MYRNKTFNRKKVMIVFVAVFFIMMFLIGLSGAIEALKCKK